MGKFYESLSMLSSNVHIEETWGVYAQKSQMFLMILMEKGQEVKKHSIWVEVRSFLFLSVITLFPRVQTSERVSSVKNFTLLSSPTSLTELTMTPELRSWLRQQDRCWEATPQQFLRKGTEEFFWTKWPLVLAKARKAKKLGMNKLYTGTRLIDCSKGLLS